jgi:hypothetical protein
MLAKNSSIPGLYSRREASRGTGGSNPPRSHHSVRQSSNTSQNCVRVRAIYDHARTWRTSPAVCHRRSPASSIPMRFFQVHPQDAKKRFQHRGDRAMSVHYSRAPSPCPRRSGSLSETWRLSLPSWTRSIISPSDAAASLPPAPAVRSVRERTSGISLGTRRPIATSVFRPAGWTNDALVTIVPRATQCRSRTLARPSACRRVPRTTRSSIARV